MGLFFVCRNGGNYGRKRKHVSCGGAVSKMGAKIYYNASRKSDALNGSGTPKRDSTLEKKAQSQNIGFIDSIANKKEAQRVKEYYTDRLNETKRKIAKLDSAEALYKNQKLAKEYRNLLHASNKADENMHKFSKKAEKGDLSAMHDTSRTTTTYDRTRKRRMSNFDAWFNAGR